jgi:hypothetical protein
MSKLRIGYLDEEKGAQISVRSCLKTHFDVFLIEVTKSLTPNDVIEYIRKEHLDLIIIDFILTDTGIINFNADAIIEVINNWNPYFPVLVLTSHPNDAINQVENVNIVNEKAPLFGTMENKETFILKLEKIIENSKRRKDVSLRRIEELARKKIEGPLTLDEEEEYYTLFRFINDSFPDDKILPTHLFTPESVTELQDLLNSAKEILSSLKGD